MSNHINYIRKRCPCCRKLFSQPNINTHHDACKRKFAEWKEKARVFIDGELGLGNIWDKDDPYEAEKLAVEAFRSGVKPKAFILETFAEDFARRDNDEAERLESFEHEMEAEFEA